MMISEEKIKVFISSKCGGEQINFDQLIKTRSKKKKDVADTAVKTSYDLVRRALKIALEATGFIETYVFEDSSASTTLSKEDYLRELDYSDVCLFLIDNFDDKISEGLLNEITRAQKTNKKSFYLFLNHSGRDKTDVQKNLKGADGVHYFEINDFRKFIDEGYKSVINDIIKIYQMYCRGKFDIDEKEITSIDITKYSFPTDTKDIDKQIFENLDQTKNKIISLVYKINGEDKQTSDFDKSCLDVLEFLLGDKEFNDIDLVSLLETLKEIQSQELHEVVCKRWEAISHFYNGEIEQAITIIESTYGEFSEDGITSNWLINDILIDWRNLSNLKNLIEDISEFSAQEKIDQRKSLVFFPIIDRFSTNINNDILNRSFNLVTKPLYSISFSNPESLFSYISNYLFTAIYYGSYTHIKLTLKETQKVIFDLVQNDNNLLHKIQLMRICILRGEEKDFSKVMYKYKSSLSHSTAKEILDLYNLANTKSLPYQRETWKIVAFTEIGYFLSDTDYENVSSEIFDLCFEWVESENPNIILGGKIIKAIQLNKKRLPSEKIIDFANSVIKNKWVRFFRPIFELLIHFDYSTISHKLVNDLISQINDFLSEEGINHQNKNIEVLFTTIRKNRNDFNSEIDDIVKEHYPKYFEQSYNLEVFPNDKVKHIKRYLDIIESRNKTQGINRKFSFYVDNPYIIIKKIIEYNDLQLSEIMFKKILKEIDNTLFSGTQTYSAKISSIHLLVFLKKQSLSFNFDWVNYYSNLEQNIAKIKKGNAGLFEKDSTLTLNLHLLILRITFGKDCLQELIEILALTNNSSELAIMKSLEALVYLLKLEKINLSESPIISVLIQYISAFCFHGDYNIRYHTVRALYQLIDSQYSTFVVSQLSKMMEDDDFRVKLGVLNQADLLKKYDEKTFNYVVSKAKIDNNYLVRKGIKLYA